MSSPPPLKKSCFQCYKICIGSDWNFYILYYPHRWTKKVGNTSTLYLWITGSNWNRKLVLKVHARVHFCSDPMLIFLSGNRP